MVDRVLIRAALHRHGARDICAGHADVDGDDDSGAVPALGVGHEVRRPRAQAEEGPKSRYTKLQVL